MSNLDKYRHILFFGNVKIKHIEPIITQQFWKSVEVKRYRIQLKLVALLVNLEEITFTGVKQFDPSEVHPFVFPNLKKLTIQKCRRLCNNYFYNSPQLKSLSLEDIELGEWNNHFQLEELHISSWDLEDLSQQIEDYHRMALKFLKFNASHIRVLDQAFLMPNLVHLSISFKYADPIHPSYWNNHNFHTNNSIRILHVQSLPENEDMLRALHTACPNLIELKIHEDEIDELDMYEDELDMCEDELEMYEDEEEKETQAAKRKALESLNIVPGPATRAKTRKDM